MTHIIMTHIKRSRAKRAGRRQRESRRLPWVAFSLLVGFALSGWLATGTLRSVAAEKENAAKTKSAQLPWHENIAEWKAMKDPDTADNSFCYVCHLNYDEEDLVKVHVRAGVGCETCHGMSDKHSEDEDNVTPPDIMFPGKRIVPFCTECHAQEDLKSQQEHDTLFAAGRQAKDACTDCHAEKHRLTVRTRKWNKRTGKLIWDDGVRMMQERE